MRFLGGEPLYGLAGRDPRSAPANRYASIIDGLPFEARRPETLIWINYNHLSEIECLEPCDATSIFAQKNFI